MNTNLKRILAMASLTDAMMHEQQMMLFIEPSNPIYHPTKSQQIKRKRLLARKNK